MSQLEHFTHTDEHWATPHWVAYEDAAIRVLCFSAVRGTPLLIVPPQAGHHSCIADYAPGQSLVECAVARHAGPVYAIEWKSCSFERRHEGITDLLAQLVTAIEVTGRCHLIALCQGGWLATIHAALHPASVASLTLAGTPIDTQAGDSVLHQATRLPLSLYQMTVAISGGLMRGETMLACWKSSDLYQHYVGRYHTHNQSEKQDRFYRWYDHVQDLAGGWYLWAIEHLFQGNRLGRNELAISGRHIDLDTLSELEQVHIVVGERDDITPPEQSLALLRHTEGQTHRVDAGHIGVFMGGKGIRDTWAPLFAGLSGVAA